MTRHVSQRNGNIESITLLTIEIDTRFPFVFAAWKARRQSAAILHTHCSIRWFRSRKRGHENGFAVEMKINGEFETFRNWDMKFPGEWTLIYMRNSSMRLIDYCSIAWYWKSSKLNEFYRRQTTWWIFSVLNPFPFIPLSNELISIVTKLQATICLIHPFTSKCGQFFGKCIHFVRAWNWHICGPLQSSIRLLIAVFPYLFLGYSISIRFGSSFGHYRAARKNYLTEYNKSVCMVSHFYLTWKQSPVKKNANRKMENVCGNFHRILRLYGIMLM